MIKDCSPQVRNRCFPEAKANLQEILLNKARIPLLNMQAVLSGGETNGRNGFTAADGFVCRR